MKYSCVLVCLFAYRQLRTSHPNVKHQHQIFSIRKSRLKISPKKRAKQQQIEVGAIEKPNKN